MLNIRYHIVYLCAVFLMLGFGILIGISSVQTVQVRQKHSLNVLQDQFNGALQQGSEAKSQLTKIEAAIDDMRPGIVHNKLLGKHVILIQTGDYAEATQDANAALSDAGAQVTATVLINDKLAALPQVAGDDPDQQTQPVALASLAQVLVKGTSTDPANQQARQSLESHAMVTITGDLSAPCNLFVLVGGGKDEPTGDGSDPASLDAQLIVQLQTISNNGVNIVGCEPLNSVQSYIPSYQRAGIATVDCVDHSLGQLALPFALRGGPDADDYGLRSTAKRQIPAALEEDSNS
jgi:predicted negative regulator of RcsB-dependent stress response